MATVELPDDLHAAALDMLRGTGVPGQAPQLLADLVADLVADRVQATRVAQIDQAYYTHRAAVLDAVAHLRGPKKAAPAKP